MRVLSLLPENTGYLKEINEHLKDFSQILKIYEYFKVFEQKGYELTKKDLVNTLKKEDVNIIIFYSQYLFFFDIEFLAKLQQDYFIVLWTFDDEELFDISNKYLALFSDYVITTSHIYQRNYNLLGKNSFVFHSGYDVTKYKPINTTSDIDISFVGLVSKNDRINYINFLEQSNIQVETYGRGSKNGFIDTKNMITIYSRTKINLNFTKCQDKSWVNSLDPFIVYRRQAKGRPIELSLCKVFCLSEYAPGLEEIFEIGVGKDIDIFKTKEELLEKVKFYLENEEIRLQMALNAYNRVKMQNDICYNIKSIEQNILSSYKHKQPLSISKSKIQNTLCNPYMKLYGTQKIINIYFFIKNKKVKLIFKEVISFLKISKVNWLLLKYLVKQVR